MYIIVGLGNPGKQYENTRHNVGFNVIDILAEEYGISVTKMKHKALIGEGRVGTEKVVLVKPVTYMNLSGESLAEIYNFYKVETSNIVVIYDDIDLDVGNHTYAQEMLALYDFPEELVINSSPAKFREWIKA